MLSFTTLPETSKQNLNNIIQELNSPILASLIKKWNPTTITSPNWIQWLFLKKSADYSIEELAHEYTQLKDPKALTTASEYFGLTTAEDKSTLSYAIEFGKLVIQKAVLNSLSRARKTSPPPFKKNILKQLLYWILFPLGTIIAICQGIDGVRSLLELLGIVTAISTWPIIICSVLGAIFACTLYYAFELEFLKDQLGLSDSHHLKNTLSIQEEQINTITEIENNLLLAGDNYHTVAEFNQYVQFCQHFNTHVAGIKNSIQPYKESIAKKILRYCIMKAGILLAIGDTLYTVTGLLGITVLNSNPLNVACLTVLALGAAIFFTVSYVDHVYATLNGDAKQLKDIKEKAENYCDGHLVERLQEKLARQKKLMQEKERTLGLEEQLRGQSKKLAEMQTSIKQQQNELRLWQIFRESKRTECKSSKQPSVSFPPLRNSASFFSLHKNQSTFSQMTSPKRRKSIY